MMEFKLFEIRDRGTFIPAFAFLADPVSTENVHEMYLLGRCGYVAGCRLVVMGRLSDPGGPACYDPNDWLANGTRTMHVAHDYIIKQWQLLPSGTVIDVEHILGETATRKVSELIE